MHLVIGLDFGATNSAIAAPAPDRYGLISFGVKNLADKKFRYQETDFKNPTIQPSRMVFAQITLAFL